VVTDRRLMISLEREWPSVPRDRVLEFQPDPGAFTATRAVDASPSIRLHGPAVAPICVVLVPVLDGAEHLGRPTGVRDLRHRPGRDGGTFMTDGHHGWARFPYPFWGELDQVRARLAAGADPSVVLNVAAEYGTAEVVAELVRGVRDVDVDNDGRTPLWTAVYEGHEDIARVLAGAGADPWRPMMSGWSPGRLSLASRTPDLFPANEAVRLTDAEAAAIVAARRLIDALGHPYYDGLSLSCVKEITAEQAVTRLGATNVETDPGQMYAEYMHDPMNGEARLTVGVTDVPGGCVVTQPWGFAANTPVLSRLLSAGTLCYAMYANPKSGNQGSLYRDGRADGWDLHPGGGQPEADDPSDMILFEYLYQHGAIAYCCAFADLKLTDARAVTGPPDRWVRLPDRDLWARS
jgi:hypothetical protein